jgi:hypothetical protein
MAGKDVAQSATVGSRPGSCGNWRAGGLKDSSVFSSEDFEEIGFLNSANEGCEGC